MKRLRLLMLTGALAGAFFAPGAQAVPKAAEHEEAPVTHGTAEAPRPRPGARAPRTSGWRPARGSRCARAASARRATPANSRLC
jgi:hypothetical protein